MNKGSVSYFKIYSNSNAYKTPQHYEQMLNWILLAFHMQYKYVSYIHFITDCCLYTIHVCVCVLAYYFTSIKEYNI